MTDLRHVTVIGVRGSLEHFDALHGGMGPTVSGVADRVEARLRRIDRSIQIDRFGVRYPAHAIRYRSSCDQGAVELAGMLNGEVQRCAGQQLVLIGLSQGAQVIRIMLGSTSIGPSIIERIAAVVLLGDPTRQSGGIEPFQNGTSDRHPGVLASRGIPVPPELWARTLGYCLEGDHVCANKRGRIGIVFSGTHTSYELNAENVQDKAAEFIVGHLNVPSLGTGIAPLRSGHVCDPSDC